MREQQQKKSVDALSGHKSNQSKAAIRRVSLKKKKKKIGSSLVHAGVLTSGFSVYINYLYIIYVLMEMYPIFGLAQTLMPFLMEPALGGNRMWPV